MAFQKRGGGISVIDKQCIFDKGYSICSHLKAFYFRDRNEAPLFFELTDIELPDGHSIEREVSTTGDECHYNIEGISWNKQEKFFKSKFVDKNDSEETYHFRNVMICEDNDNHRPLTQDDINIISLT